MLPALLALTTSTTYNRLLVYQPFDGYPLLLEGELHLIHLLLHVKDILLDL